ncbi:MAG: CoA pyrophosphatase [Alcanivoracaceae bacterium]|nr:CoA pyrophosphatase [Alcanivoracaceae bacterium]
MLNIENKDKLYTNLKMVLKRQLLPTEIWQASGHDEFRPAAVLVPMFWQNDEIHVLLTKRSEKLKHHSGQVSFPGGGFDESDITIRQAAIRETQEEIGITADFIDIVGYLDDVETISGFHVTPFVAILKDGFKVIKNNDEVAEVFSVPLSFFIDERNCQQQSANYKGKNVNYYIYQHEKYTIWGVTAEIIVKLTTKLTKQLK